MPQLKHWMKTTVVLVHARRWERYKWDDEGFGTSEVWEWMQRKKELQDRREECICKCREELKKLDGGSKLSRLELTVKRKTWGRKEGCKNKTKKKQCNTKNRKKEWLWCNYKTNENGVGAQWGVGGEKRVLKCLFRSPIGSQNMPLSALLGAKCMLKCTSVWQTTLPFWLKCTVKS